MVFIRVCVDRNKETLPQDPSAREGFASAGLNFHIAGFASASGGSSLEEAACLGKPRVQLQPPRKDASLH